MFRSISFFVLALAVSALAINPAVAQDASAPAPEPLTITASVPSSAEAYRQSKFELTATGGKAPYSWQIGGASVLDYYVIAEEDKTFMNVQWENYPGGPWKVTLRLTDSSSVRASKEYEITLSPMNVTLTDLWTRLDTLTERMEYVDSRLRDQVVPNVQTIAARQGEKYLLLEQQNLRLLKWVKRLTYASIALTTIVVLLATFLAWIIWRSRKEGGGGN